MGPDPDSVGDSQPSLTDVDVLLVDDDEQWARVTARLLEAGDEAFDIELADSLSAGRSRFEATDPDCVICDYQLGDGTGLDLLETVQETDPDCPFVLVTGRGDETVASDAIGRGVTDYIPKDHDDTDATLLTNRVRNAVVSARAQRQLDRERRGKAATLELLVSTTSMADLLEQFCRVLVVDHGYSGAWIGGIPDDSSGGIIPRAVAGCEAYLDALTTDGVVPADCVDPSVTAVDRDEPAIMSVADSIRIDSSSGAEQSTTATEEWRQLAADHGLVTAAGVPIRHNGIRAGVLCVYRSSDDPPLDASRLQLLEEYARIVGYAHQTAELKRSLLSESSVHVDIEIADLTVPLAELTDRLDKGVTVEVLSTIERPDNTTLYLARLSDTDPEAVQRAAEACTSVDIDNVTVDGDTVRCDVHTASETPEELLAATGGQVTGTVSTNGTVTVSVSAADHSMVSSLTDALRRVYDDVTVTTLWNHDEPTSTAAVDPLTSLTDKQRDVITHAYFDGYFEQPRGVSATELADKFNVSRTTTTQHLRAAQRKLFGSLFEADQRRQ